MSAPKTKAAWEIGVATHWSPEVYRALGDPHRLALLVRLATAVRPLTVTELVDCCGVHISGVSRHLTLLREAGLVRSRRAGREVRYDLDLETFTARLRGLADAIEACRNACMQSNDPACCGDDA
jgi:DNA-binding transcriptional ArsR family regulator